MKAAQLDRYARGGRLVVREVPDPEPAANEVLIEVRAAAVNPLELLIVSGSIRLIQDYRQENYWEVVPGVDLVIDTLGAGEFEHELSVLKRGGRLLSLRTSPNGEFARHNGFPWYKRALFTLAGMKYDLSARRQDKEYRFVFVHADGAQLRRITEIVERNHIVPAVDPHAFSLDEINDAMRLVAEGPINGKVIVRM